MKKLVCVTPAGRRRYMRNLIPQILCSDAVSRYDIWVNTINKDDINFFEFLENKFKKVNLIQQPEGIINGNSSINAFFTKAMDKDEIYVRMDDDIMWIIPNFFEELFKLRINDSESFLLAPLVINNSISTHIFQQQKKFEYNNYLPAYASDNLTWRDPEFAYNLHQWFLNHLENNTYETLKIQDYLIALNRFSINSISWLGSDFSKFNGIIKDDEEEYLTVIKPAVLQKSNKIIGSLIVAHYSFFTQRDYLDKTDLLKRYEKAVRITYSENLYASELFNEIESYFLNEKPSKNKSKFFSYQKLKDQILDTKVPVLKLKSIRELK
jgi:hypothetical protein